MGFNAKDMVTVPHNEWPRIYLRCVDPGTDNECWVVCNKADKDAVPFLREKRYVKRINK